MNREINTCPEFPYFGAQYPDARCIDGYLHDMDKCDEKGNLYLMSESNPCPFCNEKKFIEHWIDNEYTEKEINKWISDTRKKYDVSLSKEEK